MIGWLQDRNGVTEGHDGGKGAPLLGHRKETVKAEADWRIHLPSHIPRDPPQMRPRLLATVESPNSSMDESTGDYSTSGSRHIAHV